MQFIHSIICFICTTILRKPCTNEPQHSHTVALIWGGARQEPLEMSGGFWHSGAGSRGFGSCGLQGVTLVDTACSSTSCSCSITSLMACSLSRFLQRDRQIICWLDCWVCHCHREVFNLPHCLDKKYVSKKILQYMTAKTQGLEQYCNITRLFFLHALLFYPFFPLTPPTSHQTRLLLWTH